MSISFDVATDMSSSGGGSSTHSYSHTCSGSDLILWVAVQTTDNVVSVTYNSVAMTNAHGTTTVDIYFLVAPTSGSNTVLVTTDGTANIRSSSASYTGASQTGQPDGDDFAAGTGDTATGTVTVTATGSWIFMLAENDFGEPTAGTGTTKRGATGGGAGYGIFDSNGAPGTGSQSLIATAGDGTTSWSLVIASFDPSPDTAGGVSWFM